MTLRLTPAAEADVEGVLGWSRERGHDLGDQFQTIERNPLAFAIVHRDNGRCFAGFPTVSSTFYPGTRSWCWPASTGTAILKPGKVGETHSNRLKLVARGRSASDARL